MGTRSLTKVYDEDGRMLVNIYCQFDGYPSGRGEDLKKILGNHKVRNGFSPDDTLDIAFNGAGCMAAAIVAGLKENIGGVYLFPHDHEHEEYEYFITIKHGTIIMACVGHGELLFCGPVDSFDGKNVEDDEEEAILEYELGYVIGVDTTKLLE